MSFPTNWYLGTIDGLDWRIMRLATRDELREFVKRGIDRAQDAGVWDDAGTYEVAVRRFLKCHKEGERVDWIEQEWSRPADYSMPIYDLQAVAFSLVYGDSVVGDEWTHYRTVVSVITGLVRTLEGLRKVDPKIDPHQSIKFLFGDLVEVRKGGLNRMG